MVLSLAFLAVVASVGFVMGFSGGNNGGNGGNGGSGGNGDNETTGGAAAAPGRDVCSTIQSWRRKIAWGWVGVVITLLSLALSIIRLVKELNS